MIEMPQAECKYKAKQHTYKSDINRKLDPRDEVLALPFQFQVTKDDLQELIDLELDAILDANDEDDLSEDQCDQKEMLENNQVPEGRRSNNTVKKIIKFLVSSSETIISVSFNFLQTDELTEGEAKDYAAKNIIFNCINLVEKLKSVIEQLGFKDQKQIQILKTKITALMDYTLQQNFINLAGYYPQATPTGATVRMRKQLVGIDRREKDENDFLYLNGLIIKPRADKDYGQDIMKVINAIIEISSNTEDSNSDKNKNKNKQNLNNFERFERFNQNLFSLATMKNEEKNEVQIKQILDNFKGDQQFQSKKKQNTSQIKVLVMSHEDQQEKKQSKCIEAIASFLADSKQKYSKTVEQSLINTNQKLKEKKAFEYGSKIPKRIKPYSQKQIEEQIFTVNHSSVLRTLVKWAETFEEIFQDPTKFISEKLRFKTNNGKLVYLKTHHRQKFIKTLIKQKTDLKQNLSILIERNKHLQSKFLFEAPDASKVTTFIKRYTTVRVLSSKMTLILSQLMYQTIKIYVQTLNETPRKVIQGIRQQNCSRDRAFTLQEKKKLDIDLIESINLISFKIGDMMRSKFHCRQKQFIDILKLFYLLDQKQKTNSSPIFRLVRINDKLDKPDNNILINYVFLNKFQCQLQLSLESFESKKQKNYYSFAHFLYELTRGKFGVLSECQTIINQYDPLMIKKSEKLNYYAPVIQRIKIQDKKQYQQLSVFPCDEKSCRKIEIINNQQLLKHAKLKRKCISCENKEKAIQHFFRNILTNKSLSGLIKSEKISEFLSKELKNYKSEEQYGGKFGIYIAKNNKKLEINFYRTWFDKNLKILYIVTFGKQKSKSKFQEQQYQSDYELKVLLSLSEKNSFEEISKYFFIEIQKNQFVDIKTLKNQRLKYINSLELDKLGKRILSEVRYESVQKQLKIKNESLNLNNQINLPRFIEEKISQNQISQNQISQNQTKYQFNSLEYLSVNETNSSKIFEWMKNCSNLKELCVEGNNLKAIEQNKMKQLKKLQILVLSKNKITDIHPGNWVFLAKLKILKLDNNENLIIGKDCFRYLEQIQELNLANNNLSVKSFHSSNWYFLSKLKILDFSNNKQFFKHKANKDLIIQSFGELKSLEELSLEYNQIDFQDEVCKWIIPLSVKVLNLKTNCIKSIGQIISDHQYQNLNLNGNSIREMLLQDAKELSSLKNLEFGGNPIVVLKIPAYKLLTEIVFENISTKLLSISTSLLNSTKMLKDHQSITLGQNLKSIKIIEVNQLTELNINNLPNLRILSIQYCQKLETINCQKCDSLEEIEIVANYVVKNLCLKDMPNLKKMVVEHNYDLKQFNLSDLPNLIDLEIASNRLLSIINVEKALQLSKLEIFNNHPFLVLTGQTLYNLCDRCKQQQDLNKTLNISQCQECEQKNDERFHLKSNNLNKYIKKAHDFKLIRNGSKTDLKILHYAYDKKQCQGNENNIFICSSCKETAICGNCMQRTDFGHNASFDELEVCQFYSGNKNELWYKSLIQRQNDKR